MMNSALKSRYFVLEMMNFVLENDETCIQNADVSLSKTQWRILSFVMYEQKFISHLRSKMVLLRIHSTEIQIENGSCPQAMSRAILVR